MGALASARVLGACTPPTVTYEVDPVFDCGVVSGLHDHRSAVLWTRVAPAATGGPVEVAWEVADDPSFARIVSRGTGIASSDTDGCVKVLAGGLTPGEFHWYRFLVDGLTSPVGRTKPLPWPGSRPGRVRLVVASCQNWGFGYFPAWREVAGLDIDGVIHVGDYIYEAATYPVVSVRNDVVGEAHTLEDYRAKYRMYRSDPDLRAAHAAHAWAPVWDDHEFHNDCDAAAIAADPERAAAAHRAWFEYQPVWPIEGTRIHRRLRWGRQVDLSLLDTRQFRDSPPAGAKQLIISATEPGRQIHDPGRTILGAEQKDWLIDGFGAARDDDVTWRLVGNQVMIAPLRAVDLDTPEIRSVVPDLPRNAGVYINADGWDGYHDERAQLFEFLHREGIGNVGFLTGDIHSFWQSPLLLDMEDDASPVVGQEFVCGSISSRAVDVVGPLAQVVQDATENLQPSFRFVDVIRRGYGLIECRRDRMTVEFRTVDALSQDGGPQGTTRFTWAAGTPDAVTTVAA